MTRTPDKYIAAAFWKLSEKYIDLVILSQIEMLAAELKAEDEKKAARVRCPKCTYTYPPNVNCGGFECALRERE